MACGTPVVATGVGGSAEFLRDGENCLGFAAGDHGALAAAVHRLHDDPALRRAVVDGGFATAADLDVDHLADVFESWHDAVAARGARVFPAHRPRPGRAQPRRYVDGAAEPRAELMAAVRGARIRGTMALDLACGGPPVIARRGCATVVVRPRSTDGAHVLAHPAALPFRDDSFATVAATNVLEHLSSPEAAIHELGRVVARGGRVAVAAENVDALDRRARAWTARRRGWYRPFGTEVGRQPPLALTDPAGLRVLVGKIADVDRVTPLDWTGRRRRRALSILTRVPGMRRFAPGFLVEGTTR
jgi:SAM-dependent methyltransferase